MSESGGSADRKAAELAASADPTTQATAAAWAAGAEGERRVAEALTHLPEGWIALHDRLLYPGVTDSNIDHIVVGPGGIFMIDAKNRGGDITVHRNFLWQHTIRPDGQKQSQNLQSEVAKAGWIVKEMTRRLTVPVIPVLCLAGSRSHKFTSPQFVQDVSVVSVERLVEWLTLQAPRMPSAHHPAWVRQVMTEFPSTTTDPALLSAIGTDLAAQKAAAIPHRGSPRQVNRPAPTRPSRPATTQPRKAAKPKRRNAMRPLLGALLIFGGLIFLGANGTSLVKALFSAFTPLDSRVGSASGVLSPDPSHVPSCRTVEVVDLPALSAAVLTKASLPQCFWVSPTASDPAKQAHVELNALAPTADYDPILKEAIALGAPYIVNSGNLNGMRLNVTVASGQVLETNVGPHTMVRNLRVYIDYERLGLTPDQAREVAFTLLARADAVVQIELPAPAK